MNSKNWAAAAVVVLVSILAWRSLTKVGPAPAAENAMPMGHSSSRTPSSSSQTPAPTATAAKPGHLGPFNESHFKDKYGPNWVIEEAQGRVQMLGGGAVADIGKTSEGRQGFIGEVQEWLGVSTSQLRAASEGHARSELTEAFSFDHVVDGLPVYDSQVTLIVRHDGAVIMLTSTLKPISQMRQASHWLSKQEILDLFPKTRAPVISLSATELVWAGTDGIGERAWQILYRVVKTGEARSAILSAFDGRELSDQSAQSHSPVSN